MSDSSLKSKTFNGLTWSLIDNVAGSGVTFIVGIILARLLTPSEFGIIGIVMIFISISNIFVDGGLSRALIRKIEVSNKDYSTVFYTNILISLLFILILQASAKIIADFFNQDILIKIFPFISFLLLINGLSIVHKTDLIRKIDFKTQAIASLIASISSGVIGISLAVLGYGVWSLVWQLISRYAFNTILLWILNKWRPTLIFSTQSFKELFGFGSKLLIADFINAAYKNIFNLLIGKVYKVEQLGLYDNANRFNTILTNNLTSVIQKVSFPTLSSVQEDKKHLTSVFRKFTIYSALVSFPLILGLAAIAKPLILVLIGEQWETAALYLQILCFYGILYPLTNLNLNMLNVIGKSDKILKLELIKKIFFIPIVFIGIYIGLLEMLWASVIYYYIEFIFNSWYSEKYFNYGTWKQFKDVFPILLISCLISFGLWSISFMPMSNILILLLQVLIGILLYFICFEKFDLVEYKEIKAIIQKQFTAKQEF